MHDHSLSKQPLHAKPQNVEYKGEALDPNLKNGPVEHRECQDLLCCLLFIASTIVMIVIGVIGFSKGHPDRLATPFDPAGRACGIDPGVEDYPYIYLTTPWLDHFDRSVCVKTCPVWYTDATEKDKLDCAINPVIQKCDEVTPLGWDITKSANFDLDEVVLVYNSTGYWGRLCLPADLQTVANTDANEIFNTSTLDQYFADLKVAWPIILLSAGIAFIVGMFYMVIMRYLSGCMTWVAIILYFVCLIMLGVYFLKRSQELHEQSLQDTSDQAREDNEQNSLNLKYLSYTIWGVAAASFIGFLCMFRTIRLAIAIIKSASLFVGDVWSVFVIPPVITLFLCIVWTAWIIVFIFVYASGEITGSKSSPFASVEFDQNTRYMLWYHLFGGLWNNAFITALNQFILASCCSLWYFAQPGGEVHLPVTRSVFRAFRYHLGSLAFGALILAIVQFVRIVLAYIDKQMKAAGANQNRCLKCLMCFLHCCMACFERFIKFLTKNAYIQIAITGKGFCSAARDGFWLLYRNPGKFAAVSGIGQIFVFIGKLFIALLTAYVSYMILTQVEPYKEKLFSPLFPTIFCLVLAYLIGDLFLSVYAMAIDTILQCSCMDEEMMQATHQPPQHIPGPLKEFFDAYQPNRKK